jgi:hypothetical protein
VKVTRDGLTDPRYGIPLKAGEIVLDLEAKIARQWLLRSYAETIQGEVYLATLNPAGVLVDGTVLTRDKPMKVPADVAARITAKPKTMSIEIWREWTRARKGVFVVSDSEAQSWDVDNLAPNPNVDITHRPVPDWGPLVPVTSSIRGLIGHTFAERGEVVQVPEKEAIDNYFFAAQTPDGRNISRCVPDPSTFSPRGRSYFQRLEKYSADHRGLITSTLLDFPQY